jgi:hypothetical protein
MSKIMGLPNQRWQHESFVRGKWVEGMLDGETGAMYTNQK